MNLKGGLFVDSGKLSGLEVGEIKSRKILVLFSEIGKMGNYCSKFWKENVEIVLEEDEVCIVIIKLNFDFWFKCKYRIYLVI